MKQTYVSVKAKVGTGYLVFKADFEVKAGDQVLMRTAVPVDVVSVLSEEEVKRFLGNVKNGDIPTVIFEEDQKRLRKEME